MFLPAEKSQFVQEQLWPQLYQSSKRIISMTVAGDNVRMIICHLALYL